MIKVSNLCKVFRTEEIETTALNGVSFEIKDGEFVAIMGPSGCGKSTLLNILGLLDNPTSGSYELLGTEVGGLKEKERTKFRKGNIGFVFQSFNLIDELNVYENIELPLRYLNISASERKAKVTEIMKRMAISHRANHFPQQLSGGQQQRVAIARALVKKPRVLLLDEPLSNLDARLRLQTREEIRRIQRETGITTVFVTHDQEEAMSISDKIVVMKQGIKMQEDAPQEVYRNPNSLFVAKFLGNPPINVFKGSIKKGTLYIGEEKICKNKAFKEDKDVYVGIRPEGFLCDEHTKEEDKVLSLDVQAIQTMGRDMSLVCDSACKDGDALIKIIIDSEIKVGVGVNKFAIRPTKMFVFDGKSEERIYLED